MSLKLSGHLPLRRPAESNFETARLTYANGFAGQEKVDCPNETV